MRQLQVPFPRVSLFKPSCDLFRRPLMLQFARYDLCQGWIARQLARLVAVCTLPGSFVGPSSPVASLATVAVKLTADGGCGSTQACSHAVNGFAHCQSSRDLLALSEGQCQSGPMARWRADSAGCGQDVLNGGMWSIEQLADLVQGIALAPAIPHHRFLYFGVVDPRSLLHGQHSLRQVQSLCCIDRLNSQPGAAD